MLGPEVVVRSAEIVAPGFDARHGAQWRRYRYTIVNRRVPDPFRDRFVWWVPEPLDLRALRLAADPFVGEHDFASFCRKGPEGSSSTRRVLELALARRGRRRAALRDPRRRRSAGRWCGRSSAPSSRSARASARPVRCWRSCAPPTATRRGSWPRRAVCASGTSATDAGRVVPAGLVSAGLVIGRGSGSISRRAGVVIAGGQRHARDRCSGSSSASRRGEVGVGRLLELRHLDDGSSSCPPRRCRDLQQARRCSLSMQYLAEALSPRAPAAAPAMPPRVLGENVTHSASRRRSSRSTCHRRRCRERRHRGLAEVDEHRERVRRGRRRSGSRTRARGRLGVARTEPVADREVLRSRRRVRRCCPCRPAVREGVAAVAARAGVAAAAARAGDLERLLVGVGDELRAASLDDAVCSTSRRAVVVALLLGASSCRRARRTTAAPGRGRSRAITAGMRSFTHADPGSRPWTADVRTLIGSGAEVEEAVGLVADVDAGRARARRPSRRGTSGSFSSMPWSATSTNAMSSNTPARSTASRISPMRASLSRTDAAAISECGPPSCIAASVSVKLHHMNRGSG